MSLLEQIKQMATLDSKFTYISMKQLYTFCQNVHTYTNSLWHLKQFVYLQFYIVPIPSSRQVVDISINSLL